MVARKQSQLLRIALPFSCKSSIFRRRLLTTAATAAAAAARCSLRGAGATCQVDATIASHNKLIAAYSKAGNLASAQEVFDKMPHQDVVSWNSLMSAYAMHQNHDEVLHIFMEMHSRGGVLPNHTSISTFLSACGKRKALRQGKQVHALSVKTYSSSNVFVGTSLITMYAKSNKCECLIQVFEDIDCPNIASWNALISGFVLNLRIADARELFDAMPDRNVVSWTAMIHGYVEINKVNVALELFDAMPVRNSVTWSVMIGGLVSNEKYQEAIQLFTRMIGHGVRATDASIMEVVSASTSLKNIKQGKKFHGYAIKVGYHLDEIIEASLVSMYCKCLNLDEAKSEFDKMEIKHIGSCNSLLSGFINSGKFDEARSFFDCMDKRDKISWNIMIGGYLKCNRIDNALEVHAKMPEPTTEATSALMSSFIQDEKLHEAQKLFDIMPEKDAIAGTIMLFGYLQQGLLQNALDLFDKMPDRSVVTDNVMISGLLKHGKVNEAYDIFHKCPKKNISSWDALITGIVRNRLHVDAFLFFKEMQLSGVSPSDLIMGSLLSSASRLSLMIHGQQIHAFIIKLGHESCLLVANSLISMYCKFGDIMLAKSIFNRMTQRDVVTWNAMIYGCALNNFGENAVQLLEEMRTTKIRPDHVTFLAILSACAHMCLLEEAQHYFNMMIYEYGITPDLAHYAVMTDLMSRMGMVKDAERLIGAMPFKPDSVIWTTILSGCRSSGNIRLAEDAVDQLFTLDPRDPMPFSHLISLYKSNERWDELGKLLVVADNLSLRKQHGCSWI